MRVLRIVLAVFVFGMALVALSVGDLLGMVLLGVAGYFLWPKRRKVA